MTNNSNSNSDSSLSGSGSGSGSSSSSSSSSSSAATDTNYHSTLLLLGTRDQAPRDFWGRREVLEVPSSRDAHSRRRTFSCCGSLHMQVGLDRESRALRERKKLREARRQDEQWWDEYGKALSRTTDELADTQHDLQLAARLHNTVLEHQPAPGTGSGSGSASGGGGGGGGSSLDELDPILIRFDQSPAGRVVNLGILRKELDVALLGVTGNRRNTKKTAAKTTLPVAKTTRISSPSPTMSRSSIPQLQDSSGSSVPAPISSKPMVHARPRRYSALIPGSFKTYMAWPGGGTGPGTGTGGGGGGGEKRSRATLGLTVSQELARAVTKQLKQDEARIAQNTPYTYPREPVDGGGGGGHEEEKRNRRKMDHEQRRKTLQMWPGSSMIGLRNTSFPNSK